MAMHTQLASSLSGGRRGLGNMGRKGGFVWMAVFLLLGVFTGLGGGVTSVLAQATSAVPLLGYRTGTVTSIQGDSLGIDGTTYQLAPDVVIVDPQDRPMGPSSICVTAEVKFQVKREQASRIVKMVLYLPQ